MRYRMILFDFFNTLMVSNSSSIPKLVVDGREVASTAALLHRRLAEAHPLLDVEAVYHAMAAASRTAREKRGPELREPPALERFRDLAAELGLGDDGLPHDLLACHMEAVTGCFAFPEAHRELLEKLRATYRLGIFSNFDHAQGVLGLLRRHGVAAWFDPVVISASIGFRKPGPAAFRKALALTGEDRHRILFVGDSLEDDVQGARLAGLDVAWVNPEGAQPPSGCEPTYTLDGLTGLAPLLSGLGDSK